MFFITIKIAFVKISHRIIINSLDAFNSVVLDAFLHLFLGPKRKRIFSCRQQTEGEAAVASGRILRLYAEIIMPGQHKFKIAKYYVTLSCCVQNAPKVVRRSPTASRQFEQPRGRNNSEARLKGLPLDTEASSTKMLFTSWNNELAG